MYFVWFIGCNVAICGFKSKGFQSRMNGMKWVNGLLEAVFCVNRLFSLWHKCCRGQTISVTLYLHASVSSFYSKFLASTFTNTPESPEIPVNIKFAYFPLGLYKMPSNMVNMVNLYKQLFDYKTLTNLSGPSTAGCVLIKVTT